MKPGGGTKLSAAKTVTSEDKVRKSLHVLQPAATDKENLVGGGRMLRSALPTKETLKSDGTERSKNDVEDLTSEAGPSENYWEVLAERRRIALEDALEDNKELVERVEKLEEENRIYKEMLDESRALVEVLQEMIGEDRNDINNSLEDTL
ncbi:hypothetical protein ANTPLA_LOCUS6343 [Anthophora plagiata]